MKPKEKSIVLSVRVVESDTELFKYFAKERGMTLSSFISYVIYYNLPTIENIDFMFNGIDTKKIFEMRKMKILRNLLGFQRNEENSKMYLEERLKTDVYKAFRYNKNFTEIKRIIEHYYQESCHYVDCTDINIKLNKWRLFDDSQYKELKIEIFKTLPIIEEENKKNVKKVEFDVKK